MGNLAKVFFGALFVGGGIWAISAMGGAAPGDVVDSGTQAGMSDTAVMFEWRVIVSDPDQTHPYTGQVREVGTEVWGEEQRVALGATADEAKTLTMAYLAENT